MSPRFGIPEKSLDACNVEAPVTEKKLRGYVSLNPAMKSKGGLPSPEQLKVPVPLRLAISKRNAQLMDDGQEEGTGQPYACLLTSQPAGR